MILKGRYCVLEQLGKGGQGSVYLARDLELGVMWAIKEIPLENKREAKLQLLMKHVALPKMADYFEKGEFCYLVMEHIEGRTLQDILDSDEELTVERIRSIGIQMTEICDYLHNQKPPVCHGDLKPDNIMLTAEDRIYLIDFGAAMKSFGDQKRVVQGTRGFAAPEQYEGRLTVRSDIYGLAATLWALLKGKQKKNMWKYPTFLWILFRCLQRQEYMRLENMSQFHQQLLRMERMTIIRPARRTVLRMTIPFILLLCLLLTVTLARSLRPSFETVLTNLTNECYGEEFLCLDKDEQNKILSKMEKKLQALTRTYTLDEEQERAYLLLALNEELCGENHRAASYYEQLLFYGKLNETAYGEYGNFLLRANQQEASDLLHQIYLSEKEVVEEVAETSVNFALWEKPYILADSINEERIKEENHESKYSVSKNTDLIASKKYLPDEYEIRKSGFDMEMGGFDLAIGSGDSGFDWYEEEWEEYVPPTVTVAPPVTPAEQLSIESTMNSSSMSPEIPSPTVKPVPSPTTIPSKITPPAPVSGITSQTGGPTSQTSGITSQTSGPTSQTSRPTSQTSGLTSQTGGPTSETGGPPSQTIGPTSQTNATTPQAGATIPQDSAGNSSNMSDITPTITITPSIPSTQSPAPTLSLINKLRRNAPNTKKSYLLPSIYIRQDSRHELYFQKTEFTMSQVQDLFLTIDTSVPVQIWGIRVNGKEHLWRNQADGISIHLDTPMEECRFEILYVCEKQMRVSPFAIS